MISAVPGLIPSTIPVVLPTVAIPVLLLLHIPPNERSANVAIRPEQIPGVPSIAAGDGLTE